MAIFVGVVFDVPSISRIPFSQSLHQHLYLQAIPLDPDILCVFSHTEILTASTDHQRLTFMAFFNKL